MNKLTKITTTALFALFLTACDKLAPEVAKAETTVSETTIKEQEKADFQKIIEWNLSQEAVLAESQKMLQETINTGDKAKIEESLTVFTGKVEEVLKSLENVDVKSESVVQFKAKTKETLTLSNDLISESVKAMANPSPESQKMIQDKTQVLISTAQELQQLQMKLQEKFMPAPAVETPETK